MVSKPTTLPSENNLRPKKARTGKGATAAATGTYTGLQLNKNQKADAHSAIAIRSIKIYGASKKKAAVIGKRIEGDLTTKLIESNRFDVAEKAELDRVMSEAMFEEALQGGDIKNRLQQLQGVDYILAVELRSLTAELSAEAVPYVDEVDVSKTMHTEGYIRVINTHTGRVEVAKKIFMSEPMADNMALGRSIDSFCGQAVKAILDGLHPMKILRASGDICYVNRGKNSDMEVGSSYEVYRVGEEMFDPDTGASCDAFEELVGRIKCERVEEKRSKCRIIEGTDFVLGDIVRKAAKREQKTQQPDNSLAQPLW